MQANELRVGNLVKVKHPRYGEKELLIESISFNEVNSSFRGYILNEIEPLSINMGWLSLLGFVEKYPLGEDFTVEEYTYRKYVKDNFEIDVNLSDSTFTIQNLTGISLIEYSGVHTLQNLYFALTGEELTI